MIPINVTIARTDLWENKNIAYPGASLLLPATRHEIQDAMDCARITDGQPYKVIECIDSNGDEMSYLPENPPLDMLNILAHKLKESDDYEQIQFTAMCRMDKEPPSMLRLMNITENLQDCLCVPADDYAELGKFYIENELVEGIKDLPEKLFDCIDPAKIGMMKHKEESGIFIQTGDLRYYVLNNSDEFREVYNEINMPALPSEDAGYIFKLNIANKATGESTVIKLKSTLEDITNQLKTINITDLSQYKVVYAECVVPCLSEKIYNSSNANIFELNNLAHKIHDIMLYGECPKYKAILEAYGADSLADAITFADNIGDYEYYPEAFCAEDYGWEIFLKNHNIALDDPSRKHLRFANYGFTLIDEHNAVKTDYGFIRKSGEPQQGQSDITQGMGGIR